MGSKFRVSVVVMIFNEVMDECNFGGVFDLVGFNYFVVEFGVEVVVDVENVGNIIRYISSEVVVGGVKDENVIFCYVFVFVVINIFNDGGGIGVMDGEMFGGNVMEEVSIYGSIVKMDIINENVFFGFEDGRVGWVDD